MISVFRMKSSPHHHNYHNSRLPISILKDVQDAFDVYRSDPYKAIEYCNYSTRAYSSKEKALFSELFNIKIRAMVRIERKLPDVY